MPLQPNSDIHNYETRTQHNIYQPKTKHEYAKHCIRFHIPKTINNSPNSILNKINTHSLKGHVTHWWSVSLFAVVSHRRFHCMYIHTYYLVVSGLSPEIQVCMSFGRHIMHLAAAVIKRHLMLLIL